MIIIKESKDLGTLKFVCVGCETEFSTERGEYTQSKYTYAKFLYHKQGFFAFITGKDIYEMTPGYSVRILCPVCKLGLIAHIPSGEKPYFEERFSSWR